ncbi:hypothetical protein C4D60_Mb01t11240 [Musa balbisiana]|uniref:Uncharacterized protein n=1 Tax=Musa balbisiana TaxID=52838 RepID=A0A4S8JLE7_MUSBA|nr:hypothetical protein C4D60_Mb01t11240 [Musa balbisiana]
MKALPDRTTPDVLLEVLRLTWELGLRGSHIKDQVSVWKVFPFPFRFSFTKRWFLFRAVNRPDLIRDVSSSTYGRRVREQRTARLALGSVSVKQASVLFSAANGGRNPNRSDTANHGWRSYASELGLVSTNLWIKFDLSLYLLSLL